MPADQKNLTERLIAEPLCVRLGIDRTSAQDTASSAVIAPVPAIASSAIVAAPNPQDPPLPLEARRIAAALQAICAAADDAIVSWCGRQHKFVKPHYANAIKGTQLIGRAGAERAAQIVLAPVDEPNQHIFTKFSVIPNGKHAPGKPLFFLECEGNPTTLMTGNNVLPVTFRNPKTKKVERYPSSAHNVMTTLNRVLFCFLEDIAAQVTDSDVGLFEPSTRQAIDGGDFEISHIQWCCYLQADVSRFLKVLVTLFAPPTGTDVGVSSLAKQMGLRFDFETDDRTTRVTAVMFEKRYGKNSAYSVDFYNKRTRVGHMRQGLTLSADEEELIDNHVRFDMTAHAPAIMKIIGDAKRHLEAHRAFFDQLPEARLAKGFLSNKPKATARWLEFAVYILSHRMVRGAMCRRSLANYLVPLYLDEVLHLSSIAHCTAESLRAFEKHIHPVAKAWREAKTLDTREWSQQMMKAAKCDDNVVYACQKKWLKTYHVDIEIPRAFYSGLRTYPPVSFLTPEDADVHLAARDQDDGDEVLRLTKEAENTFFAQMNKFVGGPISTPPTLLPAKVFGEVVAVSNKSSDALVGGSSAPALVGSLKVPMTEAKARAILGAYRGELKRRAKQTRREKRARDRFQRMSGPREPTDGK